MTRALHSPKSEIQDPKRNKSAARDIAFAACFVAFWALPAMAQGPASQPEAKPLWIAVTAPGLAKAIEPLARRRAGEGFEIQILDDTTLRTQRQRVDRDVEPIRQAIRKAMSIRERASKLAGTSPRVCLVLVGYDPGQPMPAKLDDRMLPGGQGTSDNMARKPSDATVGDLDGDGCPDVSIGRLPARNPAELAGMIAKIERFESQASPAEWHHRFVLMGGSPEYGRLLDRLIETLVTAGLDRLDGRWIGVAFYDNANSVLNLPADQLAPAALAAMADGAAVNVYMGHSGPDGFFLRRGHLEGLKVKAGAGPLISLSCHGGVQRTGGDGFAVAAMRNRDGPVASFGAAEVSYPHWNKLLAEGLEKSFFNRAAGEPGGLRLADVIDGLRSNLATGELDFITLAALNLADGSGQDFPAQRKGQLQMYSLFGDPATRLPWRLAEMTLTGPASARAGEIVRLTGRLADRRLDGGKVRWLVRRPYSMLPPAVAGETPAQRHARANNVALLAGESVVKDGGFEIQVALPPSLALPRVVARAWVTAGELQAIASCRIELRESE